MGIMTVQCPSNFKKGGVHVFVGNLRIYVHPGKSSFLNRVIPIWNDLPREVREAKSLNCFKAGLDKMKLFKI
jgi:hypothetical protein